MDLLPMAGQPELVPRTDGVAMVVDGEGQVNVRLWWVSFTFGEILSKYPALPA
jgi:hypothetical protein